MAVTVGRTAIRSICGGLPKRNVAKETRNVRCGSRFDLGDQVALRTRCLVNLVVLNCVCFWLRRLLLVFFYWILMALRPVLVD